MSMVLHKVHEWVSVLQGQVVQCDIANLGTYSFFILVVVYTVVSTSRAHMTDDDFDEIEELCNPVSDSDDSISSDESEEESDMELNPVWHNATSGLKDIPFMGE